MVHNWNLQELFEISLNIHKYKLLTLQGWPSTLFQTSRWHWCESCVLVWGPYTKTQLQVNINRRFGTRCWVTLYFIKLLEIQVIQWIFTLHAICWMLAKMRNRTSSSMYPFGNCLPDDHRCAVCESEVGRLMLRTSRAHRHHGVFKQEGNSLSDRPHQIRFYTLDTNVLQNIGDSMALSPHQFWIQMSFKTLAVVWRLVPTNFGYICPPKHWG